MAQPLIAAARKAPHIVVQARIRVDDNGRPPAQVAVLQPPVGQPVLRAGGPLHQLRVQSAALAGLELGAQALRALQLVGAEQRLHGAHVFGERLLQSGHRIVGQVVRIGGRAVGGALAVSRVRRAERRCACIGAVDGGEIADDLIVTETLKVIDR